MWSRGNERAGLANVRRPLKTTFDMTTLIFSTLFFPLKGAPGTLFPWVVTENPSREVATKDHLTSNPRKGEPPRPENKSGR